MNKKVLALLSSVLSTALIVGGAFATAASWAVTDQADTKNAQITGGTIAGEGTTYVTLSWGDGTVMNDVEGMEDGKNYLVGSLKLKTDGATYDEGTLEVKLISSATGTNKLIDYVSVNVYDGAKTLKTDGSLPDGTPIATIARQAGAEEPDYDVEPVVTGNSGGKDYTIFASLNCNGSTQLYSQVKNDVVFIRVDWKPVAEHVSSANRVYVAKPSGWTGASFNVYSWKDTPKAENAGWPGSAMSAETETRNSKTYYYADVNNTTFEKFLFNDGKDSKQTVDIPLSGWSAAKPVINILDTTDGNGHYNYEWVALPAYDAAKTYKLVGDMHGAAHADENWSYTSENAVTLVANPSVAGEYTADVNGLKTGDQVKVFDGTDWYPNGGNNYEITSDGNYTVYFRPAGNYAWGDIYYFTLVKK